MRLNCLPDLPGNCPDAGRAIYYDKALRMLLRKRMVAIPDPGVKCAWLVVNSSFGACGFFVAMTRAVHAGGEIDVNQDSQIGLDVLARDSVEIEDDTGIEAAAASLINQSGIGEAVAEDDVSLLKRWTNYLLYILGATGEVKQ
jgi:hypothetical protein